MPVAAEILSDVACAATEPISSASDGQSATARSTADALMAVQAVAIYTAQRKRRRGIAFTKLIPAGANPDDGRAGTGFGRTGGGW